MGPGGSVPAWRRNGRVDIDVADFEATTEVPHVLPHPVTSGCRVVRLNRGEYVLLGDRNAQSSRWRPVIHQLQRSDQQQKQWFLCHRHDPVPGGCSD